MQTDPPRNAPDDDLPQTDQPHAARLRNALLAAGLGLAVLALGLPEIDAPWMQGDEHIFIFDNPDVNPGAAPAGSARSLGMRLVGIFTTAQGDLYQPIPIASYALEWALTGGRPAGTRLIDLLLHAANGMLLWWVLTLLLRHTGCSTVHTPIIAWALALLWALHPMLVTAWASDMGRTHLLAASFALLSLGWHVRALDKRHWGCAVGALAALLLAMLCKPLVGWILVVVALEAALGGWRRMASSPRVYGVAVICAAFAVLTLWSSTTSGIAEEASSGLFGDPVARSALAIQIYFRDLLTPFAPPFWHLPDPSTGWQHLGVWIGLVLAAASITHAVWSWRRSAHMVTVGWAWCWGLLLPTLGLVGAREVAAADRYMYQPLMGIALVAAVTISRAVVPRTNAGLQRFTRLAIGVAVLLGLLFVALGMPQARIARSNVRRAVRLAKLHPDDPRALEALAEAYSFARNHRLPRGDERRAESDESQSTHYQRLLCETLERAATLGDLDRFYTTPADRAAYHRRLSYRMLMAGLAEGALVQAESARQLEPESFLTWKRLAHAYRALERFDESLAAYQQCQEYLPDDPLTRAVHHTDFGTLLMFTLERDTEACEQFLAAVRTGHASSTAMLGMGLCEIRYGEGARGFQLVSEVLERDPGNVRAGLALAEYHARSHHWAPAGAVYAAILQDHPTHYETLRGYHEVCLQVQEYRSAAMAWHDALLRSPENRAFQSYLVWTLVLSQEEAADEAAETLLATDPDNPMACFARMLAAIRSNDPEAAIGWVLRARSGQPIPEARAFERAAATLRLMIAREEITSDAAVAEAAIRLGGDSNGGERAAALAELEQLVAGELAPAWASVARSLIAGSGVSEPLPAE